MSDETPQPLPSLKQLAATLLAADAEHERLTAMIEQLVRERERAQQIQINTSRLLIANLEDREPPPAGSVFCNATRTMRLLVTIDHHGKRRTVVLRTERVHPLVIIDLLDAAIEVTPGDAVRLPFQE